jgi:2',3'-cyclic-nucleotide 2'-phosphodiesterase (5'-nucleotidase family)
MKAWHLILVSILVMAILPACAAELGKTTVDLDGRRVSSEETNLGNFIADAVRNASSADIAVLYPMAFTGNALIPKGVVDDQAIRGVLAFPTSNVVTLKMSPPQLRNMMGRALAKYPESNMAFLQFSGMQVALDPTKPSATRVTEIKVNGKVVDFFDTKTTYTVAMPKELANGAAGYFALFNEIQNTRKVTEITLLDAVSKEFAANQKVTTKSIEPEDPTISPKVDGRLKDTSKKEAPATAK